MKVLKEHGSRKCDTFMMLRTVFMRNKNALQMTTDYKLDPRPEYVRAVLQPPECDIGVPLARLTDDNQMSSRLCSALQVRKRACSFTKIPLLLLYIRMVVFA